MHASLLGESAVQSRSAAVVVAIVDAEGTDGVVTESLSASLTES